jgi:ABC-2 type transport system ATP-binding protein
VANDGAAVVSLDRLTVRYGRWAAVSDVSLEVPAGSVYALLGRNGSGKTTTVRCLLGQWKPSGGCARLFGRDVWRHRRRLMARVGIVPERSEVPPAMTADQLEWFFRALYPSWDGPGYAARLERFAVPRRRPFGRLSKGQQRQLSLALALATSPELLVLDDPTLGLDAVARRELYEELIGELADRGTTVLVASNDITGIEAVADRVGILAGGRLVVDEEIESLKARFVRITAPERTDWSAAAHGAEMVASRTVAGGGSEAVVRTSGGAANVLGGPSLEVHPMSLEEIFVALCGDPDGRPS